MKKGVFGTKERSVIKLANEAGIKAVVDQQFDVGDRCSRRGLVPIIEPEVDIHSPEKAEAEAMLKAAILAAPRRAARAASTVMFKLTLPERGRLLRRPRRAPEGAAGSWRCRAATRRDEANARLARNQGVIASFSRALTEGLTAQQTDAEFDAALDAVDQEHLRGVADVVS